MLNNTPRSLNKGIHVFSLPLNKPLPINEVFPRELGGSFIERMDSLGDFIDKELVLYVQGEFQVSEAYQVLQPMQIIRLHLKRKIILNWQVNIQFKNVDFIAKLTLPKSTGYSAEKALYLVQLCNLVYKNKVVIKETLEKRYDIDQMFYFSKHSGHQRIIKKSYFKLIYLFLKSRSTIIDLQFMKLIQYNEIERKNNIILIFKGSEEIEDWMTNFTSSNATFLGDSDTNVHKGFQDALKLFLKSVGKKRFKLQGINVQLHEKNLPAFNENSKIILAGHSLGGAIATLAASYFIDKGIKPENIEVYTFGAPPIASKEFVDHYKDKFPLFRVVNSFDVVPKITHINKKLFHLGEAVELPSDNREVHTTKDYIDNLLDALEREKKG